MNECNASVVFTIEQSPYQLLFGLQQAVHVLTQL